jgi:hypothetical protein
MFILEPFSRANIHRVIRLLTMGFNKDARNQTRNIIEYLWHNGTMKIKKTARIPEDYQCMALFQSLSIQALSSSTTTVVLFKIAQFMKSKDLLLDPIMQPSY